MLQLSVLLATAVTAVFSLRENGIQVVGAIPAGIPAPALPAVPATDAAALLLPAIGVAIVGYVAAGLLRGFPVSSSGSRTVIGDTLGALVTYAAHCPS